MGDNSPKKSSSAGTSASVAGLSSSVAYLKGSEIRSERGRLKEWERDFTLAYVLQSGPAKGLGITWRNASLRSQASTDADQNRLFLTYSLPLL